MKEKYDVCIRDLPGSFLIQAIAEADKNHTLFTNKDVEVELLINGIPVSFKKTLENLWERLEENLNRRVEERAEELVTAAGLENLKDVLQDAEWKIKEALRLALQNIKT